MSTLLQSTGNVHANDKRIAQGPKMEQVRQEPKHLFLFEKNTDLEWAVIEPNGPPDWQNHDLIFTIY